MTPIIIAGPIFLSERESIVPRTNFSIRKRDDQVEDMHNELLAPQQLSKWSEKKKILFVHE